MSFACEWTVAACWLWLWMPRAVSARQNGSAYRWPNADRVRRVATHATWSVLLGGRKEVEYPFEKIAATSIERSMQSAGGGKRSGMPTKVIRVRLLITKPRRAILMDETQGGGRKTVDEVEALAKEVAEFLGVEVKGMGRNEE